MFKILDKDCTPTRGTKYSACVDLRAREDVTIEAGETKLIHLGVSISLDELFYHRYGWYKGEIKGWDNEDFILDKWYKFLKSNYLQLMIRSGLSKDLILANGVGIIDLDFKDELMIRVNNPQKIELSKSKSGEDIWIKQGKGDYHIKKGQRVAQITLLEHKSYLFGIDTDNVRNGGFGSTGK
jgi:dUTPase